MALKLTGLAGVWNDDSDKMVQSEAVVEQLAHEGHKQNMAGHAKSHAVLDKLQGFLEPLSNAGNTSREIRAAATAISSIMRANAAAKAMEEKKAKAAHREAKIAAKTERKAIRAGQKGAKDGQPLSTQRRNRKRNASLIKDAAGKRAVRRRCGDVAKAGQNDENCVPAVQG